MARIESDREDLLREAVALTRRVEFSIPGHAENIVAGFRDNGWFSVYFGASLMCQFNPSNSLRRAFAEGKLYRTQGNTLAELVRSRSTTGTALQRRDLDGEELDQLLVRFRTNLEQLAMAVSRGTVQIVGQVPEREDVLGDVSTQVAEILARPIELASSINTRR
jgi:hypothetical protein